MRTAFRVLSPAILLAGILMLCSCRQGQVSVNGYQFDRRGKTATRHEEGDIAAEIRFLKVDNRFGHVRVDVATDEPLWTWDLTCWAETEETAQEFTQQVELQIREEEGRGSWTLNLPKPPVPALRGVESNLTLTVPAATRVEVVNRFGDTEIRNLQGGTHARCEHGELQLTGLSGEIDAATSFAALRAEEISGGRLVNRHGAISADDVSGDLEAETRHGEVEARDISGKLHVDNAHGKVIAERVAGAAELSTSFSEIRVEDVDGEVNFQNEHGDIFARGLRNNAQMQTEFGKIELEGSCPDLTCRNQHGSIKLNVIGTDVRSVTAETSFGDLTVDLPRSAKPRIQARTTFGKVNSDFPVYAMETGADNFRDLEPGDLRLTLKNEHGDIRVSKSVESAAGQ